ncbi:MAG: 2-oxoacid:acceptor oxidoreductase subunit alpha [Gammaproteobacteria bacterium]|jgi:2-oxoglutarate ferredoxin oxidoreductase subunit alpha|nr:2-oxoacid:acceptor oxidoreductase subunit alpha [Gammaproteobacteria bacterium]
MTARTSDHSQPITVAISGSGGSGALTAGSILLAAAQRCGRYGLMMRAAGPQVRGGESVAILRIGPTPVTNIGDRVDLLAALDWRNIERFVDELPLDSDSLILFDPDSGPVPDPIAASGAEQSGVRFANEAKAQPEGRANMVAVGVVGSAIGLSLTALSDAANEILANKSVETVRATQACITAGYPKPALAAETVPTRSAKRRWRLSGNAAAGLGALRAGVDFVAAYPITPASEMLEWLAPRLEHTGGNLVQAEDELAAVSMLVGASFGGVPTLTATSGPGLSLMTEGIGLAVASETPIVVVDVARGGPSTGLPTKSEQADLDQALYGLHGDAPHLVLAPLDVGDCAFTTEWASRLAERLQTAAIVLSDQALGQTRAVIDPPAAAPPVPGRKRVDQDRAEQSPGTAGTAGTAEERPAKTAFARYRQSADGISPMSIPGEAGLTYTADGLAHDERGTPSSNAAHHRAQLAKLADKLNGHDYGDAWARRDCGDDYTHRNGSRPISLVTWGSSWGAVQEAAMRLREQGVAVQTIALRLLAPLQHEAMRRALADSGVLVVEINASGQLFRYLHAERVLPSAARSFARPGPLPLRPAEVLDSVRQLFGPPELERTEAAAISDAGSSRRLGGQA